ncbi:hypothetical protein MNBD_ALPHA06-1469 [hydrothermal vent metagenome]|uniref:DUF4169 domain-containing protein n=1 Tax=hydrothermal vent metagenome TaxID=652676 RepID=A0A3B0SN17_9ZZZZ
MAKPINLRQARKAKNRDAKQKQAAENRVKFGRNKAERTLSQFDQQKLQSHLDGHKHQPDDK